MGRPGQDFDYKVWGGQGPSYTENVLGAISTSPTAAANKQTNGKSMGARIRVYPLRLDSNLGRLELGASTWEPSGLRIEGRDFGWLVAVSSVFLALMVFALRREFHPARRPVQARFRVALEKYGGTEHVRTFYAGHQANLGRENSFGRPLSYLPPWI